MFNKRSRRHSQVVCSMKKANDIVECSMKKTDHIVECSIIFLKQTILLCSMNKTASGKVVFNDNIKLQISDSFVCVQSKKQAALFCVQ